MKKLWCKHPNLKVLRENMSTPTMTTTVVRSCVVCRDCGKEILNPYLLRRVAEAMNNEMMGFK